MESDIVLLDAHFKSHYETKSFSESQEKKVFLASSLNPHPCLPNSFIIKRFNLKPPIPEFLIHQELSKSTQDIPKLFHHWEDELSFTMCIEYLPSGTLQNYLESNKNLKPCFKYSLIYCYQLANTLFLMHSKNICHRDIKPLNIFISENFSYFKLGDFGESKIVNDPSGIHTILGTPYYMSPEQLKSVVERERQKVNPYRDDLWALGKTFWEIYTGRLNPEIFNLPVQEIWEIIDGNVGKSELELRFAGLLKEMMCELEEFIINAEQVRIRIYEIYKECQDLEDLEINSRQAYYNIERIYEDNRNPNEFSIRSCEIVFDSICAHCKVSIEGNKITLPCKHILHHKCFNDVLLRPFIMSKRKSCLPKCRNCGESISLSYFENLRILEKKEIIFCKLQEYSRCKSVCPYCSHFNSYYLLNNKLKPYNIKCYNCIHKFCSFCHIIGGHLLFCRLYKEFSDKGAIDLTRYINRK